MPIQEFGIFSRANHRILMSATTQEDTFFIKGLEFSVNSVKNPIFDEEYHWSGEKMILIPDLIFDTENIDIVKEKILNVKHNFGIAVLTPSFFKSEKYVKIGAKLINEKGTNLYQEIVELKNTPKDKFVVLANRYDGIDLPDDACRILVMDSLPVAGSLADRFEEKCREDSEIIKIKTIQKIEQGLGRSVRGEKDYSVILIYGMELIKYLRNSNARKLFSPQTQKQIEIGLDIVEMAKGDQSDDPIDEFGFIFVKQDTVFITGISLIPGCYPNTFQYVARVESGISNACHTGRDRHACKTVTTTERFLTNFLQRSRHLNPC